MATSFKSYGDYYAAKLEEGQQFQDFIAHRLHRLDIDLHQTTSRASQRNGENRFGMEIKRDGKFRETKNLYIETAEKARPRDGDYVPSGIFRGDNSWTYGIGDEKCFWIFTIRTLREAHAAKRFRMAPDKDTRRGFLLPIAEAGKFADLIVHFDDPVKGDWKEVGGKGGPPPPTGDGQSYFKF